MPLALAGALGLTALFAAGRALDAMPALSQPALFASLQAASLGGAAFGVALWWRALRPRAPGGGGSLLVAGLVALVGWRLAWFPLMVFSGHVASIAEWLLILGGLPVVVYPGFLLAVGVLHAGVALAAIQVWRPLAPWLRLALVPAFLVAISVSFLQPEDLRLLPDTELRLSEPVPAAATEGGNPYLEALAGPGYLPNQRVILLAAGLTYVTIPPSPWALTVRETLGVLFRERPNASTRDRVVEHYRAYHAAHFRVGCRRLEDCPAP